MYNVENILARLNKGEDVQAIADEMAKALNAANEQFIKEKEAEESKKAKENKLNELAEDIIRSIKEYFAVANPGLVEEMEISPEEVRNVLDDCIGTFSYLSNFLPKAKEMVKTKSKEVKDKVRPVVLESADEVQRVLDAFLKSL